MGGWRECKGGVYLVSRFFYEDIEAMNQSMNQFNNPSFKNSRVVGISCPISPHPKINLSILHTSTSSYFLTTQAHITTSQPSYLSYPVVSSPVQSCTVLYCAMICYYDGCRQINAPAQIPNPSSIVYLPRPSYSLPPRLIPLLRHHRLRLRRRRRGLLSGWL